MGLKSESFTPEHRGAGEGVHMPTGSAVSQEEGAGRRSAPKYVPHLSDNYVLTDCSVPAGCCGAQWSAGQT